MVILILFVLGLSLGSFVNALVWRLHEQSRPKSKTKGISIWRGRSMCPNCHHQLSAMDLIPVFSWVMLRGQCRYCHKQISPQYPLVELLSAALFLISYIYWPFAFNSQGVVLFVFWLVFLVGLLALVVYDLRWYILPDKIMQPMFGLALIQTIVLLMVVSSPGHQLLGSIVAFLIGGGLFYIIFQISAGRWIGGGDVKLGALLGLILADGSLMALTIFLASLLGSLVTLPLLASGRAKKDTRVPFGPFLIAAAVIARLFGASMIHWYTHTLLGGI